MGLGEVAQRREAEIEARRRIGRRRRPCPTLVMTPVDPGRRNAHPVGRGMVVEQALRDMQQLALVDARRRCTVEQEFEIAKIGLVGTDFLRREDLIEFDPEPAVAAREAGAIDVGKDDQLEMRQVFDH